MISDLELVNACAATYAAAAPTLPLPPSGCWCCLAPASDGAALFAFRGSVTPQDWVRDFIFEPITDRVHPQLGRCHAGFLTDAESIVDEIDIKTRSQFFYLTGHSLGGAIALGVGGLLAARGKAALRIATFGAPRFGMAAFVEWMKAIPIGQYRRGNDIVPELPRDVPPEFRFLDARDPLIEIGRPQADFLSCHHIDGYVGDVGAYLADRRAP